MSPGFPLRARTLLARPRLACPLALGLLALGLAGAGCKSVPFAPPPGSRIASISANPGTIPVTDGSSIITATVLESSGLPVADGVVIFFTTTLGAVTPRAETRDGMVQVTLTSNGLPGTATVTAISGSGGGGTSGAVGGGGVSGSVQVTIGVAADSIAVTATPSSLGSGGGTVELSAVVFGANGSPAPGATVVFQTTQGTLASGGRPVVTDSSGRATDSLTTTRTADVTVTSGSHTRTISVPVGTANVTTIVLAADQVSLPSGGGTSNLAATVLGDAGPIAGAAVAWSASAGSLQTPGVTFTDSLGVARNRLTTPVNSTVTAAAGGRSQTLAITVGATGTNARVAVSASRSSVPASASPQGTCAASGTVFPIRLLAQVTDDQGNPLANRQVTFYVDFTELSECGRSFGEFCATGSTSATAVTDSQGVATTMYTATQTDMDFCNCLPSDCNCIARPVMCGGTPPTRTGTGLCPDPLRCSTVATCRTTPTSEDLFCQVAIRAVSGGTASTNAQFIEYGR